MRDCLLGACCWVLVVVVVGVVVGVVVVGGGVWWLILRVLSLFIVGEFLSFEFNCGRGGGGGFVIPCMGS